MKGPSRRSYRSRRPFLSQHIPRGIMSARYVCGSRVYNQVNAGFTFLSLRIACAQELLPAVPAAFLH